MQIVNEFKLKDGQTVQIILPTMKLLKEITDFVNRLTDEDTFLTFTGPHMTIIQEKEWLENLLKEIKNNKNYHFWAVMEGSIIGSVSIQRGGSRDAHVGSIGLMVDKEYRKNGLGKYLLSKIIEYAKNSNYKIIKLDVFSDNIVAIKLYRKFGFKKYGKLANGFMRKNKYSDKIEMYKII